MFVFLPLRLDSYSRETTPINQIFGSYIRTEGMARPKQGFNFVMFIS
jgi:hypothetical protein